MVHNIAMKMSQHVYKHYHKVNLNSDNKILHVKYYMSNFMIMYFYQRNEPLPEYVHKHLMQRLLY